MLRIYVRLMKKPKNFCAFALLLNFKPPAQTCANDGPSASGPVARYIMVDFLNSILSRWISPGVFPLT
jgi:hypothetical protein